MTTRSNTTEQPPATFDWRALLPVHPAAELFPLLSDNELKEQAEDIRLNGLRVPMVTWEPQEESSGPALLDGRGRLDALARVGLLYETDDHHIGLRTWIAELAKWAESSGDRLHFEHVSGGDPYALAVSLNVHRRHLTREQRRELIAELIKASPEKSNRQIADQAKVVSPPTVAKVRKQLEDKGDVKKVYTSLDTMGRRQPTHKPKPRFWQHPPRTEAQKEAARTAMLTGSSQWRAIEALTPEQRETAASELARKAVTVKDMTALSEFDSHVLRLLQMTGKTKPARFTKTGVSVRDLTRLSNFLAKIASAVKADAS